MRRCKWNSLNHLVDHLRDVRSMHGLYAGLYEAFHQLLKAMYKKMSKRAPYTMDETIKLRKKAAKFAIENPRSKFNNIPIAVRRHGTQINGGLTVIREFTETLMEIENARRALYRKERITMESNVNIKLLAERIGEAGAAAFIAFLQDFMQRRI